MLLKPRRSRFGRPLRQLTSTTSGEGNSVLPTRRCQNQILLCDEPTGALDYQTGNILTLLQEMARKQGTAVIIVRPIMLL